MCITHTYILAILKDRQDFRMNDTKTLILVIIKLIFEKASTLKLSFKEMQQTIYETLHTLMS